MNQNNPFPMDGADLNVIAKQKKHPHKKTSSRRKQKCTYEIIAKCRRVNCPYIHNDGKSHLDCEYKDKCKYGNKCVNIHRNF